MPLLDIRNLSIQFNTDEGVVNAVDDLSISVKGGKTLCIVGESGCGKSVTAKAIMRLLPTPPGEITSGQIILDNRDLLTLPEKEMKVIKGNDIAMIFQDPMSSLNPVFTCGYQIQESLHIHQKISKKDSKSKALELMKRVGIPDIDKRFCEYPHQFSGGMRQRIMIAMALSCNPRLLIADEPTTALDVSIQAQILQLLADLKKTFNMAMLFITHDLGVVAEIADEVVVLYAGKVVERGQAGDIYECARHPYTIGLLNSVPNLEKEQERLHVIPGTLPDPTNLPHGCRFYNRCEYHTDKCREQPPEFDIEGIHKAACFNMDKIEK